MSTNTYLSAQDRAGFAFDQIIHRVASGEIGPEQLFGTALEIAENWVIPSQGEKAEEMAMAMVTVVLDIVERVWGE